ncbi:MAG: OmpA family protein [Caulobacterales bacterium]|jgi:outer membrane protein OmpA-like peptidoglycan-associated protein
MITRTLTVAMAACVGLASCATVDPQSGERTPNRAGTGAIIGAISGAALGAATNTSDGRETRKNAIIGAGIGAIAGAAVGGYMDAQERKLREQMAGTGVGVTRTAENEITLNMPSDITFDFDKASVKPEFRSTLGSVSTTLRDYPSTMIDVTGHADSVGSDAYNMDLSLRRAAAVAQALTDQGVQPQRIAALGRGSQQPIASNATPEGRAKNRRVEIKLRPVTQS